MELLIIHVWTNSFCNTNLWKGTQGSVIMSGSVDALFSNNLSSVGLYQEKWSVNIVIYCYINKKSMIQYKEVADIDH